MRLTAPALACLAAIAILAAPELARACTRIATVEDGQPKNGDRDVPTDVVPWIFVNIDVPPGATFAIVDTFGEEVPTELRVHPASADGTIVELAPMAPLLPRSTYAVVSAGVQTCCGEIEPDRITFVTGDGPLGGDAPAPPVVDAIQIGDSNDSCGRSTICISAGNEPIEVTTTLEGSGVESVSILPTPWGSSSVARSQTTASSPACFELRRRDIAGRRSAPTTICSRDVEVLDGSWAFTSLSCDGGRVMADSDYLDEHTMERTSPAADRGCSASNAGIEGSTAPLAATVLAAVLAYVTRRRRRRRSSGSRKSQ